MRRRQFLGVLGGGVATWPLAALAQQPPKLARLGFLLTGSLAETRVNVDAFRKGLVTVQGYRPAQLINAKEAPPGANDRTGHPSRLI